MDELELIRRKLATVSDPIAVLEGLFAFSPVALQIYTADGRSLLTNRAFRELFGSEPPPDYNVLEDEIARERGVLDQIHRAFAGETVRTPAIWYDPRELRQVEVTEGKRVAMSALFFPIFDANRKVTHVVISFRDETAELEARERLQRAVDMRDEFLSVAAHELRTPLTALKLQVDGVRRLLARAADAVSAPFTQRMETLGRQVQRLTGLIDTLLDLSRITAGRLELEPVEADLVPLVRELVGRTREAQDASLAGSVSLELPEAVPGRFDVLRVEQVVTNLLSNAVKYGNDRPIAVRLHAAADAVTLEVSDRGLGIALEDQARIFERFERAASPRHYSGLGLGLWITREIVKAMGGEVSVESRLGQGSTFRVVLPRDGRAGSGGAR